MRRLFRFEPGVAKHLLVGQVLWVLGWVAMTVAALWLRPSPLGHATHTQLGLPPCATMALLQKPCPGCGLTTSISATVQAKWADAFAAHPFGPPTYILASLFAFVSLWGWVRGVRVTTDTPFSNRFLIGYLALFIAYGVVRFFIW